MTDYTTYYPDSVLFERNPVCGVCWRVCKEMSEEWGGPIQFDLLASMEAADRLCRRLISNTWSLKGIEYYYHWLEAQLGFSRAAITCAAATVCLSLRLMDDAPKPLRQIGEDMQCLLWGEGGELYNNMRYAARQQDIYLTATQYGEIPPDPNEEIKAENIELRYQVDHLSNELQTMSKQINQYSIGTQNNYNAPIYHAPVYQGCTFNDSHDTHYHNANPSAGKEQPAKTVEDVAFEEMHTHFCYITDKCAKNNMVEHVEAHLGIACKGTAEALWTCIHEFEFTGYLSTGNIDATKIYNALTEHFGALPFGVINFRKYR